MQAKPEPLSPRKKRNRQSQRIRETLPLEVQVQDSEIEIKNLKERINTLENALRNAYEENQSLELNLRTTQQQQMDTQNKLVETQKQLRDAQTTQAPRSVEYDWNRNLWKGTVRTNDDVDYLELFTDGLQAVEAVKMRSSNNTATIVKPSSGILPPHNPVVFTGHRSTATRVATRLNNNNTTMNRQQQGSSSSDRTSFSSSNVTTNSVVQPTANLLQDDAQKQYDGTISLVQTGSDSSPTASGIKQSKRKRSHSSEQQEPGTTAGSHSAHREKLLPAKHPRAVAGGRKGSTAVKKNGNSSEAASSSLSRQTWISNKLKIIRDPHYRADALSAALNNIYYIGIAVEHSMSQRGGFNWESGPLVPFMNVPVPHQKPRATVVGIAGNSRSIQQYFKAEGETCSLDNAGKNPTDLLVVPPQVLTVKLYAQKNNLPSSLIQLQQLSIKSAVLLKKDYRLTTKISKHTSFRKSRSQIGRVEIKLATVFKTVGHKLRFEGIVIALNYDEK